MRERHAVGLGAVVILSAAVALAQPALNPAPQADSNAVLPGEWVSARSPAEVLAAARETLLALGFQLERDDAHTGILVTRRRAYDPTWPDRSALDLAATQTPDAARVHLRVASGFLPTRLVVGAVVETATVFVPFKLPIARGRQTLYRQEAFADFVAERIAVRLGERFEALSAASTVRARQSAPIGAAAGACADLPKTRGAVDIAPRLLDDVKPDYPVTEFRRLLGGAVTLRAEVTEHGTVTRARWSSGVEERNLVAAAMGAAGLWRFEAGSRKGCPVPTNVTLEISFSMAR